MSASVEEIRYNSKNLPPNIETAQERIDHLVCASQHIEADVGNDDRINPRTGEKRSYEENLAWRKSALHAKALIIQEKKFLERWVKRERNRYQAKTINVDFDNPKSLIHAAAVVFSALRSEDVEFTEEELKLHDLLRDYLQLV